MRLWLNLARTGLGGRLHRSLTRAAHTEISRPSKSASTDIRFARLNMPRIGVSATNTSTGPPPVGSPVLPVIARLLTHSMCFLRRSGRIENSLESIEDQV